MTRRGQCVLLALCMALLAGCGSHEHTWVAATCTEPKTCSECGETEGEPLGHVWAEATCTKPKTCSVCGATEGQPGSHTFSAWETVETATCSSFGRQRRTCAVCGYAEEQIEEKSPHQPNGEWEIIEAATMDLPGKRAQRCAVCGELVAEEEYELTEEEKEILLKTLCVPYTYEEIARNPIDYMLKETVLQGKVIQVMDWSGSYGLLVNITAERYSWSDTVRWSDPIYVEYHPSGPSEGRILEDDVITMYGYLMGTKTYTTVLGAEKTVPAMLAKYVDFD